ncbi:MAG: flagellar basal body rod protein FlgC [Ruthenibacterium sp.]
MAFLSSLDIVGSALTAERHRTDTILQNIANADTLISENGEPYRRKQVVLQERPLDFHDMLDKAQGGSGSPVGAGGVRVAQVVESDRDFRPVYDPTNPLADEQGYVMHPNVDTTEEMVDLMAASNAYEANLTALTVMKAMINKTLDLNK